MSDPTNSPARRSPAHIRELLRDIALTEASDTRREAGDKPTGFTGTATGFTALDELTGGLHPGELVVVAGLPATGKTSLVLNIAVNAARLGGGSVAVFSLEGLANYLCARLLACEARVDGQRIRSGVLDADELGRVHHATEAIGALHIYCNTPVSLTVEDLRQACSQVVTVDGTPPLSLVVVDYLQLMTPMHPSGSRRDDISEAVRGLKILAREFDVPVVLVSTLGRAPEAREIGRSWLPDLRRESETIEQDADLVMFCSPDGFHDSRGPHSLTDVAVAKHRSGATGWVRLAFTKEWMRFDDIPPPPPPTEEEIAEHERLNEFAREMGF